MKKLFPAVLIALAAPLGSIAWADNAPATALLAHVEIEESSGAPKAERVFADHAIYVPSTGEPAELDVDLPSRSTTHIKLRLVHGELNFEIVRSAADHYNWSARGQLGAPPLGQKVVIARVPRPIGAVEISLSLTTR